MLPTSAGVEPATWSPVGRRIQLSPPADPISWSYERPRTHPFKTHRFWSEHKDMKADLSWHILHICSKISWLVMSGFPRRKCLPIPALCPASYKFSHSSPTKSTIHILCMVIKYCFLKLTIALDQGPVVQSIGSLTSSLVVKILTVLVSAICNSQVFLLKKMWVAFANAKATHIFSAKILAYMPHLMIKF